jgi:anti-anti-sigma factor
MRDAVAGFDPRRREKMDLAQLSLAVKSLERASVVEAEGELGPWTVDALGEALHQAVDGSMDAVILDLTKVNSMDVGALKVLHDARSALGPDRKLCAVVRSEAQKVLEMTRFDELLSIYPKVDDALAALGAEAKAS